MRNFAVVFLVTVVTGAVVNNMEREDPLTPPSEMENDAQIEFDQQPPPTEDNESEAEDSDWMSWAGAYEGDMMLTEEQVRQLNDSSAERNAIIDTNKLWPNGVIPYVFDSNTFSAADKTKIANAFATYAAKTCLRMVPRTTETNYVKIIRGGGCYSYVGRTGGAQDVSLGYGCVYEQIIIHEFMHASGFFHEQSRFDRDTYVRINFENIQTGKESNFNKYARSKIQHLGEPYDYTSVMHYSARAFSKNGKNTIDRLDGSNAALSNTVGFSQVDINKLNKLYNCDGTATTTTTTPAPTGCSDSAKYAASCPTWATQYCQYAKYANFMATNCKKSCNQCCSDSAEYADSCPAWAKQYCQGKYANFMAKNCKKSCNQCA